MGEIVSGNPRNADPVGGCEVPDPHDDDNQGSPDHICINPESVYNWDLRIGEEMVNSFVITSPLFSGPECLLCGRPYVTDPSSILTAIRDRPAIRGCLPRFREPGGARGILLSPGVPTNAAGVRARYDTDPMQAGHSPMGKEDRIQPV